MVFMVTKHRLQHLVKHSKSKIQFLRLTGVFTLQVGEEYILQDEENEAYFSTQALIEATEVDNYQTVQFLVQQVCVDVNTQTKTCCKSERDFIYCNSNRTVQQDAGTTT